MEFSTAKLRELLIDTIILIDNEELSQDVQESIFNSLTYSVGDCPELEKAVLALSMYIKLNE